jgi:succinate dehydrogenase/fumarate reductase flavoprotein subunit
MEFTSSDLCQCDVLVIGGGGAGLRAAIEAGEAGANVVIVSKSRIGFKSNTSLSKAKFGAAIGRPDPRDNPGAHFEDTLLGGRFINNPELVRLFTERICGEIDFLAGCGVQFARDEDGSVSVVQTAGHRFARHVGEVHQRGYGFSLPLRDRALAAGVRFAEHTLVTRLLLREGRLAGAVGISRDGRFARFSAPCAVLTTGGYAQIFRNTDNASGTSGDGHALALSSGASLQDMEFVQYYPTALGRYGSRIIVYEVLVCHAGAVLRNSEGEDIVQKHGVGDGMTMTRDRLSRIIMEEIRAGTERDPGGITMDMSAVPVETLRSVRHLIPGAGRAEDILESRPRFSVSPTTHFCMGGVVIDGNAETGVPGLFAAGEVCGGAHGSNRLGGNSLSEVFAVGAHAGRNAALRSRQWSQLPPPSTDVEREKARLVGRFRPRGIEVEDQRWRLKRLMWEKVGILRNTAGLEEGVKRLRQMRSEYERIRVRSIADLMRAEELTNMLSVSEIVCRAALLRTESRGAHYREDHPDEDSENWLKNIFVRKQDDSIEFTARSVPEQNKHLSELDLFS